MAQASFLRSTPALSALSEVRSKKLASTGHVAPSKLLASSRRFPVQSRMDVKFSCTASQDVKAAQELENPQNLHEELESVLLHSAATLTPVLLFAQDAIAEEAVAHDVLKGTSLALVHPIVMGALLVATVYAGFLGWQWRRVRTIQEEIGELKKQLPSPNADGTVAPSPVDARIKELTEERKELIRGGYRDKHWDMGALLLGGGTTIAVAGCVNTYIRTGRLFPGPHLFAGAGIVTLWAVAASLVPYMQKGDNNARNLHIALNAVNVALFLWQVPTGLEIVGKVFEFTTFP